MHFFIKTIVFLPTSLSAVVVAFLVNLFWTENVLADSSCHESPAQVNVSDLINDLEPSCQGSIEQVNVSDLINERTNISEQSLSSPVSTRFGESRELFEQGIQQYQDGQYPDSERSLKLALDKLNGGENNRFQAPQTRREGFSIGLFGIELFEYYRTTFVPSEGSISITAPLDEMYARVVNSLVQDDAPESAVFIALEYQAHIAEQLLSGNVTESYPNTDINEINSIEDVHQLEIKILRFLQKTLIAQNQQQKIEEALGIAQLTRNLEQVRVVPAIAYALNNEVLQGNQVVDNRLPELLDPDILSLENIKNISQEQDATLVYYSVVSDKEIFAWIIQPTGKVDFEKIELASIEFLSKKALQVTASFVDRGEEDKALIQAVRQLRLRTVATSSDEQYILDNLVVDDNEQKRVLRQLYQILINPIKEFLPTDPEADVVFIPQDALLLAPFPALKDATGQYLIEQHTIRIAPNLQALAQSKPTLAQFPRNEEILIVGNPANPKTANLPGAEEEARSLSIMSASSPLIGSQATSATVSQRLSDAEVIHLATHGILDLVPSPTDVILIQSTTKNGSSSITRIQGQSRPDVTSSRVWYSLWYSNDASTVWHIIRTNGSLPGAVALSDHFLTSQEIINFGLNADLVVLSACNTAQGQIGESNILGLPFSLGIAGVPNVVVSLWPVPDDSTRMLMYEFYSDMHRQDFATGEIDIAQALRKAMLAVKNDEKYRDPIHWAGFLLMNVSQ